MRAERSPVTYSDIRSLPCGMQSSIRMFFLSYFAVIIPSRVKKQLDPYLVLTVTGSNNEEDKQNKLNVM